MRTLNLIHITTNRVCCVYQNRLSFFLSFSFSFLYLFTLSFFSSLYLLKFKFSNECFLFFFFIILLKGVSCSRWNVVTSFLFLSAHIEMQLCISRWQLKIYTKNFDLIFSEIHHNDKWNFIRNVHESVTTTKFSWMVQNK